MFITYDDPVLLVIEDELSTMLSSCRFTSVSLRLYSRSRNCPKDLSKTAVANILHPRECASHSWGTGGDGLVDLLLREPPPAAAAAAAVLE